jgi:hypothetical protein
VAGIAPGVIRFGRIMTTKVTPQSVAAHSGILFVSVTPSGREPITAGDESYASFVADSIALAHKSTEPEVKVTTGKYSVEIHKSEGIIVAIAFLFGDPVVKSVQRMFKKLAQVNVEVAKPVDHQPHQPLAASAEA